ncbi:WD40 repeat-like protein [Massarina eburnea CBS 473.64]|uniref:WD40 repeat-like protein n=1 Tax=Massarina eburnea CBS 473.64 TaxID=1395130 RepID=A0A6A6RQP0_9PLEO|nr:WD40 repeat-like protein [Massarina eburnea CBS 473.64]
MHKHSELPALRSVVRLEGGADLEHITWFDIKFYPYTAPAEDPVFAVVGSRFIIICRCVQKPHSSIEVLCKFEDDPTVGNYNSIEWSQAENGDPLVCVAGNFKVIKILNVITKKPVTTLVGHGNAINDLAISPVDPTILVSGSADHAIRLWSLDPAHAKQPTAAILYHKAQVLTVAYHRKGRYLLSGGMDHRINMWTIPEDLKDRPGTDKPAMVHYPHFSTTEIHKGYIDCIRWYNDLILSSAAGDEQAIQLWKIDNFNGEKAPPNPAPIPLATTVSGHVKVTVPTSEERLKSTRSAWGGRYQRLLQFKLPDHSSFYFRFSIFHQLGAHPVLVAGNEKSKVFFWDLQRLEDAGTGNRYNDNGSKKSNLPQHLREGSTVSASSNTSAASSNNPSAAPVRGHKSKKAINYGISNPFHPVKWHKEQALNYFTAFRQFSWSNDGQWCVGAAEFSMICVFNRWQHGVPPPERGREG